MKFKEFQIEFTYSGVYYQGLVQPFAAGSDMLYRVNLEDENQETNVEIILRPSTSTLDDWEFECLDGSRAVDSLDKDLLTEAGEQVEAFLISDSQEREVAAQELTTSPQPAEKTSPVSRRYPPASSSQRPGAAHGR